PPSLSSPNSPGTHKDLQAVKLTDRCPPGASRGQRVQGNQQEAGRNNTAAGWSLATPIARPEQDEHLFILLRGIKTSKETTMVISHQGYRNSRLPASASKPFQLVPIRPSPHLMHWLPIAARIKFSSLIISYKTINGSASQ
ncbi:hypothetical protein Z043_118860, partial [Scleropages formosus]